MTDRERELEARKANWEYGEYRLNQMLATRNSAVTRRDGEGRDILVCTCRKCLGSRRFGTRERRWHPEGVWHGVRDGECVVKKCLA